MSEEAETEERTKENSKEAWGKKVMGRAASQDVRTGAGSGLKERKSKSSSEGARAE